MGKIINGRNLALKKDLVDLRDIPHKIPEKLKLTPLPKSFSVVDGLPEIWDQKNIGSCSSFASSAAFMFEQKKQNLPLYDPSQLFLYYNERVTDGDPDVDGGSTIRTAMKTLADTGLCESSYWSYDTSQYNIQPPQTAYDNGKTHLSTVYRSVSPDLTSLKTVIFSDQPIVFGISVYSSFMSDQAAQTGLISFPNINTEDLAGGHAILLCAFNDDKQLFTFRNSWGTSWGDPNLPGYGYLSYEYVMSLGSDFWTITFVKD